ncbi:MAG TPA: hypothetical protein VFE19_03060, partial [Jatrophihabitantaceae bacterium]|nr:hypothetical protein [Jatrophihabitantaceae bacterium]
VTASGGTSTPNQAAKYTFYAPSSASLTWSQPTATSSEGGDPTISCVSRTFCAGVDTTGHALTYNGTRWTRPVAIDNDDLRSLSCSSRNFCVAADDHKGAVVVYRGSTWSAPHVVDPAGRLVVSCTSKKFCLLLTQSGHVYRYNGHTWHRLPRLAGAATDSHGPISSVSCANSTFCVAGTYGGQLPAAVYRYNGTKWHLAAQYRLTVFDLSCASTVACGGSDGRNHAFALHNGKWTKPQKLDELDGVEVDGPDGNDLDHYTNLLTTVSCTAADFCIAFGESGNFFRFNGHRWVDLGLAKLPYAGAMGGSCSSRRFCVAGNSAGVTVYNGRSRTQPTSVDPTLYPSTQSCAAANFCVVAGATGPTASIFNGSRFSRPVAVGPDDSGLAAVWVDCASSSFCALVRDRRAATFNGAHWTASQRIDVHPLVSVSCSSTHLCAAADRLGKISMYDGHNWSAPVFIDKGHLMTLSCAPGQFCAAVDDAGRALTYRDGTWSTPSSLGTDIGAAAGVSCPSTTFCLAITRRGAAIPFNGTSWGAPVGIVGPPASQVGLISVSCVSSTYCAASGSRTSYVFDGATWGPGSYLPTTSKARYESVTLSCGAVHSCLATDVGDVGGYVVLGS